MSGAALTVETAAPAVAAARALVSAAAAEAARRELALAVAVCDAGGHLVAFERMDGAPLLAIDTALDKAYTAAAAGIPSGDWYERIKDDAPAALGMPQRPRLMILGGGLPLRTGGTLVGGIGVSGAHYRDDLACAAAAVAAVGFDG